MKKRMKRIVIAILYFLSALVFCSVVWALRTWVGLRMDELVYHLMSPLQGAGRGMIGGFLLQCLLPAALVGILSLLAGIIRDRRHAGKEGNGSPIDAVVTVLIPCAVLLASAAVFGYKVDFVGYVRGQTDTSAFVQEHYADPKDVAITFPEEKRNLIYIYLESMETTFADQTSGGAYAKNYIPELTDLALANQCFAGGGRRLNGGVALPGSTWTMGAMMAQTSGLPLQLSVKHNAMSTQRHFFNRMTALGDVLEEEGYHQVLLLGSKASFGGRDTYFREHGDYDIIDYKYAVRQGWIPEDYYEFWGYEDEKLIAYAKEQLLSLAQDAKTPFNLTMLTVDTHFEDGYECRLCNDAYGEPYANALACSSRQITDFVDWIRQQDFYEDTTIVLSGDHLTMDSDFCGDVAKDYARKTYTAIINGKTNGGDADAAGAERAYSTFDLFPTTLAALDVAIEGDRLGLGVNLYSDEKTLIEEYGEAYVVEELGKKSLFIEELADIDMAAVEKAGLTKDVIWMRVDLQEYDVSTGQGRLWFNKIHGPTENTVGFEVWVYPEAEGETYTRYVLDYDKDAGGYVADISLSGFDFDKGKIRCFAIGGSKKLWETTDILPVLFIEKSLYEYERDPGSPLPVFDADADVVRCLPPKVKKRWKALGYEWE